MDDFFENVDVIFKYTAEQAVKDGILFDVTEIASHVFQVGCDMTWKYRISVNVQDACCEGSMFNADRLLNVLNVARDAIRNASQGDLVEFYCKLGRKKLKLWAMLDTTSGPAIHIITPEEN